MGVYIKNWLLADWKEHLKWAKIGANNAMIGEFAEVEEIPPHGDLIDRDALMENAQYKGTHDIVTAWDIVAAPTIIPASFENPAKSRDNHEIDKAEECNE